MSVCPTSTTPSLRKREWRSRSLPSIPSAIAPSILLHPIAMQQLQTLPISDRQILGFEQEGNLMIELWAITPFLKQF